MAKAASDKPKPKAKTEPKPKLSDEEQHKRFVAIAREAEANERREAFDAAFKAVVRGHENKSKQGA